MQYAPTIQYMNVLIISLDKGLLGSGQLGDVVERHREYGRYVENIDIIVLCKRGYESVKISDNVMAHPTNSRWKIGSGRDAYAIGSKLFEKKHYDLIVTQDPFITGFVGARLKRKFRTKLLIHFHGDFFGNLSFIKENWKNYFLVFLAKRIIKKADAMRAMSEGIKESLIQSGILKEKIAVIPTPVDIEKFQRQDPSLIKSIKKEFGGKKLILFVGRLEKVKDVNTLLAAFKIVKAKYHNCALLIIGKGSQESELKSYCLKENLEAHFLGQKSHQELVNYYYACGALVLTSLSESFGKVLVEANACGKPVISTATTGARDIIQDGYNGYLVPIGDPFALANKIEEMLLNINLARQIGENGKKLAYEKFDGRKNIEKIIAFWKNITNSKI